MTNENTENMEAYETSEIFNSNFGQNFAGLFGYEMYTDKQDFAELCKRSKIGDVENVHPRYIRGYRGLEVVQIRNEKRARYESEEEREHQDNICELEFMKDFAIEMYGRKNREAETKAQNELNELIESTDKRVERDEKTAAEAFNLLFN